MREKPHPKWPEIRFRIRPFWVPEMFGDFHSQCVGCAWRFRAWSRSSQRIQNPGSRWIHRGGGPSSRGVGEAWKGRSAHGQSQVSGTPSKAFAKTQSVKSELEKVAFLFCSSKGSAILGEDLLQTSS